MIPFGGYLIDPEAGLIIGPRGRPVGSPDTDGYLQVDGRTRGLGILSAHQLIWQAVHGPIPDGVEVNHRNGVKTDNRIANLELLTHQQNIQHAYANGLKSNAGEKHPSHRLTEVIVIEVRRRRRAGEAEQALAAEFGVSRRTINDVVLRRSWAHVGEEPA